MTKTLLVDVRELTDSQRATIADAARARGFRAAFASNEAEAEAVAPEAEILFSLNAALLKNAPKLKWWCVPYAGVDAFLKPALEDRRDILLSSSSGAYGVTIAEHIVMVTLMLMRRQMEYTEVVRNGGWRRDLPIRAIRGSRIAVLGAGDIGREAAVRLRAFGPASVVGVNRSGKNPGDMFDAVVSVDALDDLLQRVDVLIMALPDTPETRHILDVRRLHLLPEDAFIVNVGRGSVCARAPAGGRSPADVPAAADHPPRGGQYDAGLHRGAHRRAVPGGLRELLRGPAPRAPRRAGKGVLTWRASAFSGAPSTPSTWGTSPSPRRPGFPRGWTG